MAKHFSFDFDGAGRVSCARKPDSIAAEAALDGIYVVRTNVGEDGMDDAEAVESYKQLARVERAFRSMKAASLRIRPICHWNANRVRAHLLVCMLAYYVEWHMRQALAPLLFAEEGGPRANPAGPVAPPERSERARAKDRKRETPEGLPVSSFEDLLENLGALSAVELDTGGGFSIPMLARPTPLQEKAFSLLRIKIHPPPAGKGLRPAGPAQ